MKDFWAVVFFIGTGVSLLVAVASAIKGDFAKAAYFMGAACLMHMTGRR